MEAFILRRRLVFSKSETLLIAFACWQKPQDSLVVFLRNTGLLSG